MPISALKLFLIFIKIGAILLGGGYVILPILNSEFYEQRKLLSCDEILEYFVLSQSMPGVVAINVSLFIGYRLCKVRGAILAAIGIIFIPFLCIIALASVWDIAVNNQYMQHALWGVEIAVVALILLTVQEVWQNTTKDLYFYAIFLLSFISLLFFKSSPILTILIFTTLGLIYKILCCKRGQK